MVHRLDDFGSPLGDITNGDSERAKSALFLKLCCLIPFTIIDDDAAYSLLICLPSPFGDIYSLMLFVFF